MHWTQIFQITNFISQIQIGQKPCFKTQTLIPANSILGSLSRTWHKESRMTGITYLEQLYQEIKRHLDHKLEEGEKVIKCCQTIARACQNLKETYKDDIDIADKYHQLAQKFMLLHQTMSVSISTVTRNQQLRNMGTQDQVLDRQNILSTLTGGVKPEVDVRIQIVYPFYSASMSKSASEI